MIAFGDFAAGQTGSFVTLFCLCFCCQHELCSVHCRCPENRGSVELKMCIEDRAGREGVREGGGRKACTCIHISSTHAKLLASEYGPVANHPSLARASS
jgi:hypothetical protein